jgi:PKD repeat protein
MHIFAHSGSYVVSLRVAAQSQSNTTSKTIVVKTAVPAAAAWRFFAPGSNVDSAVFYGMGSGAFNLAAHDIVNAGATPPGHFTQGDSFVVSYVMSPPSLTVYAQGTFLNNDSAVSMKYTTIIYPASGPPAIYDSGVFYGIRKW